MKDFRQLSKNKPILVMAYYTDDDGNYIGWTEYYDTTSNNWENEKCNLYMTSEGLITPDDPGDGLVIGILIESPTEYISGVPGVEYVPDDPNQKKFSLGTFITVKCKTKFRIL